MANPVPPKRVTRKRLGETYQVNEARPVLPPSAAATALARQRVKALKTKWKALAKLLDEELAP